MDTGTYEYMSLPERDSIRLIVLQPSTNPDEPLRGSLMVTSLSACDYELINSYTALSYVWGTSPATVTLMLDSAHKVTITATLAAALRDMRDARRPHHIWADAVCINQQDLAERNHQVSLMGAIYRTALHTVIHLGAASPETALILGNTPRVAADIRPDIPPATRQALHAAAATDLLQRPWFKRVWVFQELVLSRDPWVQCGTLRARWTDLVDLLIPNAGYGGHGLDPPFEVLSGMQDARAGMVSRNAGGGIHMLLEARRGLGATDPRDFVYAHLGLASDAGALVGEVPIDYSLSAAQIFGRTARFMLRSLRLQVVIDLVDGEEPGPGKQGRLEGLASWAPDWTKKGGRTQSIGILKNDGTRTLNLQGQFCAFVDEPLLLVVFGYEMGEIHRFGPLLPAKPRESISESYNQTVNALQNLYSSGGGVWWSGDEFGQHPHVDIRGKQEEHAKLCKAMGEEWIKFLKCLGDQEYVSDDATAKQGYGKLLPELNQWLEKQAATERIYTGEGSDGLIRLLADYMNPQLASSPLEGRRLAATKDNTFGVVPESARKGDVVTSLAKDEAGVLLHPIQVSNPGDLQKKVRAAVAEAGLRLDASPAPSWLASFHPEARIEHCELLGHCFFDGQAVWAVKPQLKSTESIGRLFALH
jgi:hypothetical protein